MSDLQHLDLLKQGVFIWNQWRQEHPEVLPDLNGADLAWAHLSRIDLSGANLYKANLQGADLQDAQFYRADLREANLNGTNLLKAILDETTLTDVQENHDGEG